MVTQTQMTIGEILTEDFEGKNVLIIGPPASGKSYLINLLELSQHKVIKTDDYAGLGFEQSMYAVLEEIGKSEKPTFVEGVQGYRLLRKGLQLKNYYPDVVIEMKVSRNQIAMIYGKERGGKDLKKVYTFCETLNKILQEYLSMQNDYPPRWIVINNERM